MHDWREPLSLFMLVVAFLLTRSWNREDVMVCS